MQKIKLAQDTIDKEDLSALSRWLETNPQLTKGALTEEFEAKFASWMGVKNAVMVNSGSSANLLMLDALVCAGKIERASKVVVPAICWATDLSPVLQLGLTPVVCDVNLSNAGVDVIHLEEIFKTEKPSVLMLVSVLGMPPDMETIEALCRDYGVILLEDACESLGSRYSDHLLGTFGYASTTSLYFGHHISTIEGGMIFTNDDEFADILRMMRAHGWDRDLPEAKKRALKNQFGISDFNSRYTFYYPAYNFRSTEINAFLGLRQLDKLEEFIKKRKRNFDIYNEFLKSDYWKPFIAKEHTVSNLGYPVIHTKRNKIASALDAANVENRPFISGNIIRQPVYGKWKEKNPKTSASQQDSRFPNADLIHKYGMYVPNHPFLTDDDIYRVCKVINSKIN